MLIFGVQTMGNGSIRPRAEDLNHDPGPRRVLELELELRQKDQDFRTRLDQLQKELDSKTSQIHKLQDALGHHQGSQRQLRTRTRTDPGPDRTGPGPWTGPGPDPRLGAAGSPHEALHLWSRRPGLPQNPDPEPDRVSGPGSQPGSESGPQERLRVVSPDLQDQREREREREREEEHTHLHRLQPAQTAERQERQERQEQQERQEKQERQVQLVLGQSPGLSDKKPVQIPVQTQTWVLQELLSSTPQTGPGTGPGPDPELHDPPGPESGLWGPVVLKCLCRTFISQNLQLRPESGPDQD
ncbi:cAMP-dependent protein kinase catalytic subunit-like [Boleophthalmus pectinirostris]|uniref:cAMP-dependent protein kinase catalytic subunit-like n=1 Tax=Boleophthalmus pectinirostris TaxID=150288 RepID=UPI00242EA1D8|nr:cAMP-dependent protein kinase catalytic subunit-like [Boleophthalmus pectinirostris]